jgi:uncharacterized protein
MAEAFFFVRNQLTGAEREFVEEDQRHWIKRRQKCGRDRGWLQANYEERMGALAVWRNVVSNTEGI